MPAYDFVVKAAHQFNVLDARGAIGVTERARFIGRVRGIAKGVAEAYLAQREALGFPLLRAQGMATASAGANAAQCVGLTTMCTLVLAAGVFPGASLVIVANRDELLDRPSSPPLRWSEGFVAPRDDLAGGTWLGINAAGVFVGITNRWLDRRDAHVARPDRALRVTELPRARSTSDGAPNVTA